jgi:hypothetical protein
VCVCVCVVCVCVFVFVCVCVCVCVSLLFYYAALIIGSTPPPHTHTLACKPSAGVPVKRAPLSGPSRPPPHTTAGAPASLLADQVECAPFSPRSCSPSPRGHAQSLLPAPGQLMTPRAQSMPFSGKEKDKDKEKEKEREHRCNVYIEELKDEGLAMGDLCGCQVQVRYHNRAPAKYRSKGGSPGSTKASPYTPRGNTSPSAPSPSSSEAQQQQQQQQEQLVLRLEGAADGAATAAAAISSGEVLSILDPEPISEIEFNAFKGLGLKGLSVSFRLHSYDVSLRELKRGMYNKLAISNRDMALLALQQQAVAPKL